MSSQSAKLTANLIVLKGADNYFKWASTLTAFFMIQGQWKIVNGTTKKPSLVTIPMVPAELDASGKLVIQMQKPATNNQDKIDKWEDDDMSANGTLNMYVDIEIRGLHMKATSHKTWEALKTQYGTPSSVAIRGLLHDMNNYTIVDHVRNGKDFPAQLEELAGLMTQVASAGHPIEQVQRVIILTEALPPKWRHMVDAAMVAGVFTDVATTTKLLTQKYLVDKSAKKAHTAMPAKITGLQRYTPKPQNQGQQQQPRPGPATQPARTQKNMQKQPANAGAPAPTAEQQKQKKKAINKARKDRKKVKRAAMAALQAENADGILIDRMSDVALTAADNGGIYFNERSFTALMAENDGLIGQDERAADGLASGSLTQWLEETCLERERLNTPPADFPSTPPPELFVESPSSMGYTDDESDHGLITRAARRIPDIDSLNEEEQNVVRILSGQLTIRNPDLSVFSEARPLPVPPPRSETAPPARLQSPIKLEIKEEQEVKFSLKKERSASVTFSPTVEVLNSVPRLEDESPLPSPSAARPSTTIPTTRRRSAFRNVPSISTQTPQEVSEQLFRSENRTTSTQRTSIQDEPPTVPNSPVARDRPNPFRRTTALDDPLNSNGQVHAVKITMADKSNISNVVQPQPRNPFKRIFFPPTMDHENSETTLDRVLREREDHISTTNLLHNPRIHPTTEMAPIPFPVRMSSSRERMFKRTGEISPPDSRAREWVQSLERPVAQDLKQREEKGKNKRDEKISYGPKDFLDMSQKVVGPGNKSVYDYYSKFNVQIINELMQAPVPDIKLIAELLRDIDNQETVQIVSDFLDKQIQNVLNHIEDEFQQDLLDVHGIRELRKKLQISKTVKLNHDCLRQGFVCTKNDLGYNHKCTGDLKDHSDVHMASHNWHMFKWINYTVPNLKAKWKELLTINQMHGTNTKNYCLGCSPKLMDLGLKMINYHIEKIKETKTSEVAPHKIYWRNGYPTFSFNDRLPENEFHCNLAGWDNAQKLDFKALPWNNDKHNNPMIIPLDTVFNFHTLAVINNWTAQFMWKHKMFGYCHGCNANKDKDFLRRLQTLYAFNASYRDNEASSLREKYIP